MTCYIEAEYESGYVHREDEQDHSPYVRGKNIFSDILEGRPCAAHGRMTRFSIVVIDDDGSIRQWDVDWTKLPDNARPIRFKHMQGTFRDGGIVESRCDSVDFGYQYTDGSNFQSVVEIPL